MAIERTDIFTFRYFDYGEVFHGSYRGMRYELGRFPLENVTFKSKEEKENGSIRSYIWPEPFSFANTPDEEKEYRDFTYSEEGVRECVKWLNDTWESKYANT